MSDIQVIPDWVMIQAAKRAGMHHTPAQIRAGQMAAAARPPFYALCEMILQHETAPVDRKLLCARQAAIDTALAALHYHATAEDLAYLEENKQNWRVGSYDKDHEVRASIRAIELWEEGFGA